MPSNAKQSHPNENPRANAAPRVEFVTVDDASAGQRLDNFLVRRLKGVPKSYIYRIVRAGEVRVNKGRSDVAYRLTLGDVVRVPPVRIAEKKSNSSNGVASKVKVPEKALQSLSLLFEDDAVIAINKPSGMAVHGGSGISLGLIEALRAMRPDAIFLELVHRIDRETSGVLLIAKKRSVLTALHAQLRGETGERIAKHYTTLVRGAWPDARRHIRTKLAKFVTAAGERRVTPDEEDGQESHTIVTRLDTFSGATLLDCDIRTGRTHQIRVHLSSLDFPIVGDDKYGDFALNKFAAAAKNGGLKRMFLHARTVEFLHPLTNARMKIEAPLPLDLQRYLVYLRGLQASGGQTHNETGGAA